VTLVWREQFRVHQPVRLEVLLVVVHVIVMMDMKVPTVVRHQIAQQVTLVWREQFRVHQPVRLEVILLMVVHVLVMMDM